MTLCRCRRACRCCNSWRYGRRNVVELQSSALTLLSCEPKSQNTQQFITMCRTRHFCRYITMYSTNNHHSCGAYAEVTARTEVPELAAAAAVSTHDAATSSQRHHATSKNANANSVATLGKMARRHPLNSTPRSASHCPD